MPFPPKFLTAISHRGLRNDFFFHFLQPIYFFQFLFGLLFPFSIWTFISLFYLDISRHFETFQNISRHFETFSRHFRDILRHSDLFSIFFRSFQSRSDFGFLPKIFCCCCMCRVSSTILNTYRFL